MIDIAKHLGKRDPDFHFVVTLGNSERKDTPPQVLADNITVVSYLPYTAYLPQFDYVIHHGGAGIFYNCIQYGKPVLILPHDYDQADYVVRGREAQIAYVASKDKLVEIEEQFKCLVEQEDWSNLQCLSSIYQQYQPSQVLLEEIERILIEIGGAG